MIQEGPSLNWHKANGRQPLIHLYPQGGNAAAFSRSFGIPAAAAISAACSVAGAAIGAANTFDAALLLLMDEAGSQTDDNGNHRDHN